MKLHYLEFEKPLQQLASKVEELESAHRDNPKLNIYITQGRAIRNGKVQTPSHHQQVLHRAANP